MNKALKDFSYASDAFLDSKAMTVLTAMTGNPNYPTSTALVTALQTAKTAYSAALAVAEYGTPSQISEKNDRKSELVVVLKNLCDFVNFTSPGERTLLLTTGFSVGSETNIPAVTEPLRSLTVVNGQNKGSVIAKAKKGTGTRNVLIQYAVAENLAAIASWSSCPGTKASCTVSGLPSGSTVWFRAAAVGPRNQVLYCEPVNTIVL